jgi:hypothetical protein
MSQVKRSDTHESLRAALLECDPLIKGSLVVNRRRCGKPQCRCSQGHLHESMAITYKQKGRSVLLHVPADMESEATVAIRHYQRLKELLSRLSDLNLATFRRNVQLARAAKAKARCAREGKPKGKDPR